MKGGIEKPRKRHYVFGGYYISTDKGVSLTNTQIIDADGKWNKDVSGYTGTKDGVASWVCAADTVLYAKWTDSIYTVAVQVSPAGAGEVQVSSSAVSEVTAGYTVRSSEMTPVGASVLWKFKEWQVSSDDCVLDLVGTDYHRDFQPGTDNKMKITARATGQTLTAVFEPRYTLVGKIYDSESDGGMPGMSNYTVVFPPSDLTCTRNLLANTKYQVEIHDLARGANMGRSGCASGCVLEENTSLVMENQDNVVFLNTTGAGYYIFKITNINGSGNPTLTVLRPHQVNFGRRRKDIDNGTHDDNTGGTLSVKAGESAISSGAWVTYNDTVTYTTSVQPGYEQAWYTSSDYSSTFSAGGIWGERLRSTSNVYAQFTEQAKTVTINKTGKGTITVDAAAFTWGQTKTCGVTTTRRLVATADDGYSFSSWTVPDGVNFQLDDKESDTDYDVTLRGKASGSNGTLTANFTENKYTITVSADATGGGTVSTTEVTAGIDTKPEITATITNKGWHFKQWNCTGGASVTNSTSATTNVSASETGTVTAIFERRYILVGSELDDTKSGMPGWVYNDVTAEFTETSYTTPGDGEDITVDFRCTRTLLPNRTYKFSIHDRAKGKNLGDETDQIVIESGASKLCNTEDHNIRLNATGYGNYTFKITKLSNGDNYPTVTIDRPTVYQLNLGWTEGGTVSAYTRNGATPTNYPIVNGQYVSAGDSIVFAAVPAAGYSFEGWHSSDAYNSQFATDPNMHIRNINATVNAYAKFVPVTLTFTNNSGSGDGNWNTASNWSPACVPTLGHDVTIQAPVVVAADHATAKSIVLDQNSKTGKLTIQANKGLEVAGTITRTTNGEDRLATRPEDLVLESSSAGNASLVFTNSNSCAATVEMYSIGEIVSESQWNWQFMGTPFTSANALYSYYGSYLYEWKSRGDWDVVPNGGTMTPFTGYCITQDGPTTYVMDGTLNPNSDVNISIPASKEFVMANSWTAPISVCNFTTTTLPLDNKTIYLFNTGYAPKENGAAEKGSGPGTFIAMPINSAVYTGNYLIAPMEGFYVDNRSGSAATITLKYDELVRPSGSHTDIVAGPMHAPKRVAAEAEPDVMKIKATGSRYADRVVILARQDFSTGFDNGWDGKNLNEPGVAPIIYALRADGTKDAVSAIPSFEGTVVGFRQGEDNQYTFSFDYDGEDIWYLNDLKQQKSTLIDAAHNYSFTTVADDIEARFVISATPIMNMPTGVETVTGEVLQVTGVRKIIINDQLFIIRAGRMYNAVGTLVK